MIRAAVEAANSGPHRPLLFGVTVLTSMAPDDFFGAKGRSAKALANVAGKLALHAQAWGMDGVVCSGHEARAIRRATGLRCLTPGIRLASEPGMTSAGHSARPKPCGRVPIIWWSAGPSPPPRTPSWPRKRYCATCRARIPHHLPIH